MTRRLAALAVAAVAVLLAATPASAGATTARVYLLQGESFTTVDRTVTPGPGVLDETVRALLRGPTAAETRRGLGTAIPERSRLRSARIDTARRTVRLRFNRTFADADETPLTDADDLRILGARLAQVVYTTTALTGLDDVIVAIPGHRTLRLTRDDFDATAFQPPAPPPAQGPAPTDVRSVQAALIRLRYLPPEAATATFDDRTQQAVLAFQSWEGLARDGLVGPQTAGRLTSAAIPAPSTSGTGRRVEIHRAKGVVLLVEGAQVTRAIHTSTGSGGDDPDLGTPPGSFRIYRKEARSWSIPFKTWLPYAAYWNRGWALHGYPDVPAFPASHGCARLPLQEAPVVYDFVTIGTPVRVF